MFPEKPEDSARWTVWEQHLRHECKRLVHSDGNETMSQWQRTCGGKISKTGPLSMFKKTEGKEESMKNESWRGGWLSFVGSQGIHSNCTQWAVDLRA